MMNNNNNNNNSNDRNSSSLNHGKRKKRPSTSMDEQQHQQPQHANSSLSSKQNDSVNSNNTNPSSSSTSKHCHHHHHHGTKTNNTTTRTFKHFDTEGQLINVESRIIDTPTNNNSVLNLPNSVLPAVDASSSKNNNEITNREYSASSSSSSPMNMNIQTRGGLEGIFSQNNVDTMMSNIIQQILSTLSMQQERMNNIEQQQQQGFTSTTTPTTDNNMSNASKDPREDQQQKIQQTCTTNNQQQETPSSSASSNNENQQFSDPSIGIERGVSSNYSSFNNGSGDVGHSSLTTSSSRSSSNNTTNSSTTSVTSTSSSSFVNNNSDSKRFTLSSGNTSSTLEFLNNNSTTHSMQNNHQQHSHNDQLSDSGISQLFEECTNSSFNIDASASSLINLPKSTSEFNLEDYHDLFSDARSVREFGDDTTSQQDPNAMPQFQSNNKQPNTVLDNMNEPMLWGMLRQMLTDNETLPPNIQNEQNNEQAFNNPTSNSTSSNNSNMAPYFQVVSASSSSSSNIPPQSSGNNFRHNNFQQEQTHSTNFNNMPQSSNNNNNNNNNGNSNGNNNMRQLISTLFSNLNTGRQTQPTLQLATIPDYKSEEVSEEIEENDFQLSSHPSDPPTADSTKQILGSIRKTLSNKINNTPNQFQHKYGQGVQQKPSDGFIKWLSEHSAPQNQQIKEQDTELEEPSHHHHQPQPPTSSMSQFKFYNEMISERNTSNTHPSSSNDNIKDSQSHSSTPNMKPLKIFQHDPHKQKKKKDLQNGEHIMNFQSPQSDNTVTTTTSIESTTPLDKSKRKRKDDKHDNQTETKRKKKTKKKKD